MKRIFNIKQTPYTLAIALLIARVGIASLMFTHGLPKLEILVSGAPIQFPPLLGMSAVASLSLTVFAEVLCSALLLFGLATRMAVIPLIITMLVALIFVHSADPISKQEPALHYLLVYLVLLFAGPGKYSLDYLIQDKVPLLINRK